MVQPSAGSLLYDIDDVSDSLHVHAEYLIAFFFCKGQRSGAMPGFVDVCRSLLEVVAIHSKVGLQYVAFQYVQLIKAGFVPGVGLGHERQDIENAVPGRRRSRSTRKGRNPVTIFQKTICEMTSNESRRTGNKYVLRHGHSEVEFS